MSDQVFVLKDGRSGIYSIPCLHSDRKKINTIETYDMDDWPCREDVYLCLDCGYIWNKNSI